MKNTKVVGIVLALVIVGLLVSTLFIFGNRSSKSTKATDTATTNSTSDTAESTSMNMDMSDAEATGSAQVSIDNYMFMPTTTKIKTGGTVTWTNKDSVKHNVVADNASATAPNSQLLARGESYTFKFDKAGTYSYHCDPHPYMKATVTVTD